MTIMIAMLLPVPSVPVQGRSRVLLAMAMGITILAAISTLVALLVEVQVTSLRIPLLVLYILVITLMDLVKLLVLLAAVPEAIISTRIFSSPRLTVSVPDL